MLLDLAARSGLYVSDSRHACTLLQILCSVLSGSEMRSRFYLCESPGKEYAADLFPRWGPQQWDTVLGCGWERNPVDSLSALLCSDKELNRMDTTRVCHRLLSGAKERA